MNPPPPNIVSNDIPIYLGPTSSFNFASFEQYQQFEEAKNTARSKTNTHQCTPKLLSKLCLLKCKLKK